MATSAPFSCRISQNLPGLLGPRQQNLAALHSLRHHAGSQPLAGEFFGHQIGGKAVFLQYLCRGRADHGDLGPGQSPTVQAPFKKSGEEETDGIDAGEDQPLVVAHRFNSASSSSQLSGGAGAMVALHAVRA
jgi:hypothetical protein